jgi:hypothetical protein
MPGPFPIRLRSLDEGEPRNVVILSLGWRPLMVAFDARMAARAAVADVVRVLHEVQHWPSWNAAVSYVDRRGSGPLAVGEKVTVKQPRLPAARWTVTAVDGSGFAWVSSSLGVHSTGEHWVQQAADGRADVTLKLILSGPLAPITGLAFSRLIRRYIQMEADGLRREVEGRA